MGALKNPKFVLPVMSHSSGTITATFMNGSSLSRLISADVTLVANTLYMVYLVASGGTAALRISTNVNSVGPAGFTTWTLVGAFYSNGMIGSVAFGSFVNIVGVPTTDTIPFTTSIIGAVTNPTIGTTARNNSFYSRIGDLLFGALEFRMSGAGTAGSGIYKFLFPGVTADSNKVMGVSGSAGQSIGACIIYNPNVLMDAYATVQVHEDFTGYVLTRENTANRVGSASFALNTANTEYGASYRVPILGWSNRSLVDL